MSHGPYMAKIVADYERIAAPFADQPLPLHEQLWVAERLRNSLTIAATKTGRDRALWIEDARYFRMILEQLRERDQLRADAELCRSVADAINAGTVTVKMVRAPLPECQHDLLRDDTTVVVDTPWDGRCTVCQEQWHLPRPSERKP